MAALGVDFMHILGPLVNLNDVADQDLRCALLAAVVCPLQRPTHYRGLPTTEAHPLQRPAHYSPAPTVIYYSALPAGAT